MTLLRFPFLKVLLSLWYYFLIIPSPPQFAICQIPLHMFHLQILTKFLNQKLAVERHANSSLTLVVRYCLTASFVAVQEHIMPQKGHNDGAHFPSL
jgi:hypothetical protein